MRKHLAIKAIDTKLKTTFIALFALITIFKSSLGFAHN